MSWDAISPVDGRYRPVAAPLASYFSEQALMRYRLRVEVEWLRELAFIGGILPDKSLTPAVEARLASLVERFDNNSMRRIKEFESVTGHDVKAVEYFLREQLEPVAPELEPFVHWACTSDDINNIAYALMQKESLHSILLPAMWAVVDRVADLARAHADVPILSLTHGQPATPSTLGKELAVFVWRWRRQLDQLERTTFLAKFSGAVGTWGAHTVAYPDRPWPDIAERFVHRLGLDFAPVTTQIEPHDYMAELFHNLSRFNTICIDFARDIWLYISRGYFRQKPAPGQVGSSTMPHKVNPIQFENAEANCGLANALFDYMAGKLPVSRLQRDLTDSSTLRNVGTAFAHTLIALKALERGLGTLEVDSRQTAADLDQAWEVLAEAVQTVLRKNGRRDAYEVMKTLTQGQAVDRERLHAFIQALDIDPEDRRRLLDLTPATYLGFAPDLARRPYSPPRR
jgi:adenylosuccinate lyase